MKRALLVAVVALPATVLAQVAAQPAQVVETTNFNSMSGTSYINQAQCNGTAASNPLNLEWQVSMLNAQSFTTVAVNAKYKLFASNTAPAAAATGGGTFCAEQSSTTPTTVTAGPVANGIFNATAAVMDQPISGADVVKVGTTTGSCVDGQVVYICSHLYAQDGTTRLGFATGIFQVQLAAPGTPTGVTVGSGDGRLAVSWAPGSGSVNADHFVAFAVPSSNPAATPIASGNSTATSTTIAGLQNGTQYDVTVVAYSVGGNPSGASAAVPGTPMPGADFWEVYRAAGGTEGGCSSGAGGALALLGTASLLVLRRRKP
jgi:uncharacterized protein (TIGR03382 family)